MRVSPENIGPTINDVKAQLNSEATVGRLMVESLRCEARWSLSSPRVVVEAIKV